MKLKIVREDLLKPLQSVIGVVEKRQTMPILANVLINVTATKLCITATDLEVELSYSIPLDIPPEEIGTITVSGRKITDICRTLPPQSIIELECTGKTLKIRSQNSSFNLATLPIDEFPKFSEQPEKTSFVIQQSTLLSLVKRTYFAVAEDNPHYYLNGLLLDIQNGTIRAIASDAHRMSLYTMSNPSTENISLRIIVPKNSLTELQRLLVDNESTITIAVARNYIIVQGDNFTLTSKLIDSKYPNYGKQLLEPSDKKIVLNQSTFKEALIRVGILSNELLRSMRLELEPNLLKMVAYNSEQEQAEEQIAINYNGEHLEIGFNIAYLLDVLATIKTEKIVITLQSSKVGAIIEEVGGNEDCFYVVMPFEL